jgi:uncharacterized protein (TIRG00374 family)
MNQYSNKLSMICILGFIVSGVFGFLSFRDFDWGTLKSVSRGAVPWLLTLAGLFLATSIFLRAYRWKFFLPPDMEFSYHALLSGVAIGYFFSNIFPGRMGDLLRPGYVSKASNHPFSIIFYSVVIERIFEMIMLLLFALTLLKYNGVLADILRDKFHILYGIVFTGLLLLFFARHILSGILRISNYANFSFISKPISQIIVAFEGNFHYKRTLFLILLSVLIFFVDGLVFVYAFDALQLQVTFIGKFTTMVATSLGHLIPSAPAGVGVFHYLCKTSLMFFGVDNSVALSAAILVHAFYFLFDIIFGLFFIVSGPLKYVHIVNRSVTNEVT